MAPDSETDRDIAAPVALPLLLIELCMAAYLRFRDLGGPSLWLDEILNYDITAAVGQRRWWMWLIGFERENGPLYYASQRLGFVAGSPEVRARLLPAFLGVLAVGLMYLAGKTVTSSRGGGLVAAALMAVSPLHVYYSREGRTYSLLIIFCAAMMIALLEPQKGRSIFMISAAAVGAAYTAATAASVLIPLLLIAVVCFVRLRGDGSGREKRFFAVAAISAGGALVLMQLLYGRFARAVPAAPFEGMTSGILNAIVNSLTVTAKDTDYVKAAALVSAALVLTGSIVLVRRRKRAALVLVGMCLLSLVTVLGSLAWLHHWFSARYIAVALPPFLLLATAGIDFLAGLVARVAPGHRRLAWSAAAVMTTTILVAAGAPAASHEPFQKANWRAVASTLWYHARPGDSVVVTNSWTAVSLRFYLAQLPPRLKVIDVGESVDKLRYVVSRRSLCWIVSAGFYQDPTLRPWLCNYALLFSGAEEDLRLYLAPSRGSWLANRATAAESADFSRAFEARGNRLSMGVGDSAFLLSGWGNPEEGGGAIYRWMTGTTAQMIFPLGNEAGELWLRLSPAAVPLAGPMRLRLRVGSTDAGDLELNPGWGDYRFSLAVQSRPGPSVITFSASAAAPSSAAESRTLSVAVSSMQWRPSSVQIAPAERYAEVRLQTLGSRGEAIDLLESPSEQGAGDRRKRLRSARWKREALHSFLSRFGRYDESSSEDILTGRTSAAAVAEQLMPDSECSSDDVFVGRCFRQILGREPDAGWSKGALSRLASGVSREKVLRSILYSDEFAKRHFE